MSQTGDPQLLAIPVFCLASIALGTQLVNNWFLSGPIAIILAATGLMLLVSTLWAAGVGQSYVACVTGLFGGFWLSYGFFVIGVLNDWWAFGLVAETEPAAVSHAVVTFALSWTVVFIFLTLGSLRLPVIYPLIFGLVCVALILVAIAYKDAVADTDVLKVAGIVIWVFAALGIYLFMTLQSLGLGGPAKPGLGPVLIKPKPSA